MKARTASQSSATATHIVLPDDTNTLGNLMGGRLMYWMDVIAAVAAHRHSNRIVVTASVNNISFNQPIKLGDIVTLESKVSRAFGSSMEVFIDVWVEDHRTAQKTKCTEAIFTFVAVDQIGNTIDVPELIPESEIERQRFDAALRRRQLSLILAGRMKPKDATELKAIFEDLSE
jgi:acyl-CoA hydrolase